MIQFGNVVYFEFAALFSILLLFLNLFTMKRISIFKKRDIIRSLLWSGIILFLGMALSSAKLNWKRPMPVKEKMEIIFALDASLSALARDVEIKEGEQTRKISRLDLEKQQVENVIGDLRGDAVYIIVFADQAIPLHIVLSREDYKNSILRNLKYIDKDFVRHEIKQGTDYGMLILGALEQFGKKSGTKKVFFVLTDGESQGDETKLRENLEKALELFAERDDISVYLIGLGNPAEPSRIPETEDEENNPKEYYREKGGEFILTRPNPEFLNTLANATKGKYIHAETAQDLKNILESSIEKERKIIGFEKRQETIDLTPYLLICSLVFLFIIPTIKSV